MRGACFGKRAMMPDFSPSRDATYSAFRPFPFLVTTTSTLHVRLQQDYPNTRKYEVSAFTCIPGYIAAAMYGYHIIARLTAWCARSTIGGRCVQRYD